MPDHFLLRNILLQNCRKKPFYKKAIKLLSNFLSDFRKKLDTYWMRYNSTNKKGVVCDVVIQQLRKRKKYHFRKGINNEERFKTYSRVCKE